MREIDLLNCISERVDSGNFKGIDFNEAIVLANLDLERLFELWSISSKVNKKQRTNNDMCASLYVDSRPCPEDCSFCPLSSKHYIDIKGFDKMPLDSIQDRILEFAQNAHKSGLTHFKIVSTGLEIRKDIFPKIKEGIRIAKNKYPTINICISGGVLSSKRLTQLKSVGLDIYNNNLEASKEFYSNLVTTHSQEQKIQAIKNAQKLGLKVCSGGIIGIGEDIKQRIELAFQLRELNVYSSPINIYVQFPDVPATKNKNVGLDEIQILKTIAIFRMILPKSRLVLGGGRSENLSDGFQKLAIVIGASALQSSGYLAKTGLKTSIEKDHLIFKDIS